MATYFITGSSRGIGLALATLLASKSDVSKVFASARSETESVKNLVSESNKKVEFVKLDVVSQESIKEAVSQVEKSLGGKGLDVLVNNAGIMPWTQGGVEAMNDLDEVFKVNVVSVQNTTAAFLPLLKKGSLKKIVNISTTLGSIARAQTYSIMSVPAYKISKAALNMLTVQYALSLADDDFTVVALSPGWIKTDLGSANADLTVEEGTKAVYEAITRFSKEHNGKFFNVNVPGWEHAQGTNQYDGEELPW
ncbi:short-chain dehydrogenase-like protein [Periconia macrospinosa]|uniref:Short-chain dehydrogenase-like protein n=1 Tax=Periconia macrospinosa TaxID=97972 RepID=A0A2V1DCR5_9PLEO|nr:short-chain dehydrogenase-like protein [Periconia macrospinosa]